jgi:hypothetical protein
MSSLVIRCTDGNSKLIRALIKETDDPTYTMNDHPTGNVRHLVARKDLFKDLTKHDIFRRIEFINIDFTDELYDFTDGYFDEILAIEDRRRKQATGIAFKNCTFGPQFPEEFFRLDVHILQFKENTFKSFPIAKFRRIEAPEFVFYKNTVVSYIEEERSNQPEILNYFRLNLTFTFSDENFKEFLFKWFDKVIFSNTKALSIESVNKFELDSQEVKKIHDLVPNLGNWYFFNNITIDFTDINKKNSITQVNLIPNHESIPKGLENLKNLKTLILKLNKKSSIKKLDVSFVKQLKQLEDITLNESSISDYLELEIKKISPKIKVYKETIKYKL